MDILLLLPGDESSFWMMLIIHVDGADDTFTPSPNEFTVGKLQMIEYSIVKERASIFMITAMLSSGV